MQPTERKPPDPLHTVKEIATLFKVGPSTVRRWITDEKLKAFKVNGYYRISHSALVAFSDEVFKDLK